MNGVILQGLKQPLLVTQGYSVRVAPTTVGQRTVMEITLAATQISGRAGTQIEAACARCRLALGRP